MKKICLILLLILFSKTGTFAMIPPKYMLENINNSKIKTPAVVKSVKTISNNRGNRTQRVVFEGLYYNSGKEYEATINNFQKRLFFRDFPVVGIRFYKVNKGDRVFVTIQANGMPVTSLIFMDEDFEKKLKENPKAVKYDCNGAYFEK